MPTAQVQRSSPIAAQSPLPFTYRRSRAGSTTTIAVCGELDIASVSVLDRQLRAAARDASLVVLDLRSLEFVDSSGAALLLWTSRRMRQAGGRLLVVRGPLEVQWLLELTRVDRELEFAGRFDR
jgi:anti-anti-sigma factor